MIQQYNNIMELTIAGLEGAQLQRAGELCDLGLQLGLICSRAAAMAFRVWAILVTHGPEAARHGLPSFKPIDRGSEHLRD